jgi:hypothetical protein
MLLPIMFLDVDAEDDAGHWNLSFAGVDADKARLRLTLCAPGSAETETISAEIANPNQIGVLIDRVRDVDDDAHALAGELLDMLFTLAAKSPRPDCVAFLVWRLCVWISENRRAARATKYAA